MERECVLTGIVTLCITLRPPRARSEVGTGTCPPGGAQQVCLVGEQSGHQKGEGKGAKASAGLVPGGVRVRVRRPRWRARVLMNEFALVHGARG